MRYLLSAVVTCCAFAQNPLVFENELVRVVKAANVPTQKSRPHVHLVNRVMVHLDKGTMQIVYRTRLFGHNFVQAAIA